MKASRFSELNQNSHYFLPQGALASVPKNFKDKVQCIGYNLDTSQPGAILEEDARAILETALREISEPVSGESVNFSRNRPSKSTHDIAINSHTIIPIIS